MWRCIMRCAGWWRRSSSPSRPYGFRVDADNYRVASQYGILCRLILAFPTGCDILIPDRHKNKCSFSLGNVASCMEVFTMTCTVYGPALRSLLSVAGGL